MAFDLTNKVTVSLQAGADLSGNQFLFVAQDSTNRAVPCSDGTFALGILENQPSSGANGKPFAATISVSGVTRLAVYGAYAIGTYVVPGSDGTHVGLGFSSADAIAHSAGNNGNYKYRRAKLLQASTAKYDIVTVQLQDEQPGVDSTVL